MLVPSSFSARLVTLIGLLAVSAAARPLPSDELTPRLDQLAPRQAGLLGGLLGGLGGTPDDNTTAAAESAGPSAGPTTARGAKGQSTAAVGGGGETTTIQAR